MSSDHPGRYQSRLFNFLNRQTLKFTDQCDRTLRQLKVSAVWGAQILLYPVYLLVQSSLSAGRQLASAIQTGLPSLKVFTSSQPDEEVFPTADTPIGRVLSEVNTLLIPQIAASVASSPGFLSVTGTQELARTAKVKEQASDEARITAFGAITPQPIPEECDLIQGVATQLETRTLVLVTGQNQILDILTQEQQQKLASRISWEVADLRRRWRLAMTSHHPPQRLANLDQPRVLLPIRLFWNLMAWVQTSPVAIAANVFQEATLAYQPATPANPYPPQQPSLLASNPAIIAPHPALAFLDRTVAELESHQLVPGSEVVVVLSEQATSVLQRTQKLRQQLQIPFITPKNAESLEAPQPNTSRIQALIYAAVDYFFGKHGSTLPPTDSQAQAAISPNSQAEAHQLSGCDTSVLLSESNPVAQTSLPEASNSRISVTSENSIWRVLKRYLNRKPSPGKLRVPLPSSEQLVILHTPTSDISTPNFNSSPTTEASQNHPFRVQALIYAAIDYFFGRHRSQLPRKASHTQPKSFAHQGETPELSGHNSTSLPPTANTPNLELAGVSESDPWLTWDDLFDDADGFDSPQTRTLALQSSGKRSSSPRRQKSTTPKKSKTSLPTASPSRRTSELRTIAQTTKITTPASSTQDSHLEPAPDWIEAKSLPVGYVKHPLEQLLGWLDLAMVRVEKFMIKIWQWLKGLLP